MFRKRLQLALIHVAVAMTLVPINSTLNRVMIKEMGIAATLVAILASLPYLFSPLQMVIGSYADRHPWFGFRRTPYIALGLALCVLGVMAAPQAVFSLAEQPLPGILLSVLAFGAWGMGFNIASVSYLSLASEISGEKGRSRTVSVMWFVMIVGIIITAASLSRLLNTYTHQTLQNAFAMVGGVALVLGVVGLIRLEPRQSSQPMDQRLPARENWQGLIRAVLANPSARHFFFYLIILLAAILGQDVLLEPYGGEAFGLSVSATTRITSIWGGCVLVTLLIGGWLEQRLEKRAVAQLGGWGAMIGLAVIALGGVVGGKPVFYTGVVLLGLGTGLSTVANLSLMFDMITAQVGLYIGAWGVADALARLFGSVLGGAVRDVVSTFTGNARAGYIVVFLLEAGLLGLSLWMLARIDVQHFRQLERLSMTERAELMNDVS